MKCVPVGGDLYLELRRFLLSINNGPVRIRRLCILSIEVDIPKRQKGALRLHRAQCLVRTVKSARAPQKQKKTATELTEFEAQLVELLSGIPKTRKLAGKSRV